MMIQPSLRTAFPLVCLLLAAAGCSTSSRVVIGQIRPPVAPDAVQVYHAAPADFHEIALVSANSKGALVFTDQEKLDLAIGRLKAEAAKVGANGVLIESIRDEFGGTISFGFGTGTWGRHSGASVGVGTSAPTTYKIVAGTAIFVEPEWEPVAEPVSEPESM